MSARNLPLIEVESLGKAFNSINVLTNISIAVSSGEVHVLAGKNGAGKSTLLRILSGVYDEFTGNYAFEGESVRFRSPAEAAAAGIVMIHQELSLVPWMSVLDNIFLGREFVDSSFGWLRRKKQVECADRSLKYLGLDLNLNTCVNDLPVAQQQMVEIARALTFDAKIIIFDEPTSALSQPETDRLLSLVGFLRNEGKGVIYTSHKMDEIYRIADRITVLRDGCHVLTKRAAALSRDELVKNIIGQDIGQEFPERLSNYSRDIIFEVKEVSIHSPDGRFTREGDSVNFSVRRGEIVGIAGLEGSGSHELLLSLFGNYGVVDGEVRVEGRVCSINSPVAAIQSGLALVTNDRKGSGLILDHSVNDNTTLAVLPRLSPGGWLRPAKEREVTARCVEQLRVDCSSLDQEVGTLSGGNQQKVLLGKWLETNPKVLLLDDPTRGVDIGAKCEIYRMMRKWSCAGMAIVLLSSELPELLSLSDRLLVMHRGRVTGLFNYEEFDQHAIMRCALGECQTTRQ